MKQHHKSEAAIKILMAGAILGLAFGLWACQSSIRHQASHADEVRPPGSTTSATVAPASGAGTIRVLLLSGQNNHDWKTTTPELKKILEASGRFRVDIIERPDLLTAQALDPYDVILSNWNAFDRDQAGSAWPEETKRDYLDFIRQGKGHVVVHAGSSSFPDWADYGRLTLAAWKIGQTSHGPRHEFPVRIENAGHPVTAGLREFTISDELWNRPGMTEGAEVLASSYSAPDKGGTGQWEPSVLAGRFGRGRSLTLLLGHDAEAMENQGFQTLLRRGVEWAATGVVSAEARTAAKPWRFEKEDGASLALIGPAGLLWRFRYDQALDTPYFHPLNSMDGRVLTWDRPPDHIWHHGLWFSWKFINAINYWEIDQKTGRPAGRTSWKNVKMTTRGDHSARIDLDLVYRPAGDDTPVLTEKRTIEVGLPDREGAYSIDWTGVFKAVGAVVLNRTPPPGEAGGQAWGGYAGLSLRLAGNLGARQAMTTDGPVNDMPDDRYRGRHKAVDYSGLVDGLLVGVAICDHPQNPRAPTPWYIIRSAEMSFFTPAVLCYEAMALRPGERITLRYRVLVHPGRWDAVRLRTEVGKFAGETRQEK